MYNIELHDLVLKGAQGEALSAIERKDLTAVLCEEEQSNIIAYCSELMKKNAINDIIDYVGYMEEDFCRSFHVDAALLQKWRAEGMSSFEHYMLIYAMCTAEIAFDRMEMCPACGEVFFKYKPVGGLCTNCRAEMLLHLDDMIRARRGD